MPTATTQENIARIDSALSGLVKALIFRDHPPAALAELPLSQLRCVRVISENEGAKMQDLAHKLYITLPALSQIVDRLVRRNMVERRPDAQDRRIVRLHLTESARDVFSQGREERLDRIRVMASCLTHDETESGIRFLERMAQCAELARPRLDVQSVDPEITESKTSAPEPVHSKTKGTVLSPRHAGTGQ